ncbi:hypothetical protein Patl1_27618 [Pistacia atlantica]|uniref:Uncharacterized protein n=1 Tax=Pistacia atlantica TaxID=434234 RepID=A0ACC1BGL3_9ROSI|nr:hypothetical protein Patl1_27618 [Pistacia atlantica]
MREGKRSHTRQEREDSIKKVGFGFTTPDDTNMSETTNPEPSCWGSFCDWCCCSWCCDKQNSSTTVGQAGNGIQTIHTETEATTHDYSKMNGGQSSNGNASTATNKSNSGQASAKQSAIGNAATATNKSSFGQASAQQSANDKKNTAKDKSNSGQGSSVQASGQQSANDNATSAKNKSGSSGQASVQLTENQEHSSENPGIGEKNKKDRLLGAPGSSDQYLGKKTGGTEQAVHNSSLKGAIRQEDTKKNTKDLNPRKEINSMFEHSAQEQAKGPPLKNENKRILVSNLALRTR